MVAKALPKTFIAIYLPMAGWKAVMYSWDDEMQMHEPWSTSDFAWATPQEAERYAKEWAEAEEVEYVPPTVTFSKEKAQPGTLGANMKGSWYRCPNLNCRHAFPSVDAPKSCPQCGHAELGV